jgi:hypothetical protein
MNNILAATLAGLTLGAPATFKGLTVLPLLAERDGAPDYLTLDEALEAGLAKVTEVSESGRVPERSFLNDAEQQVLLVDGEELVGARQNRILNLTILVAGKSKVVIPVSCVEHGRWSYRSREFRTSKRNLYARARAGKMESVSLSMQSSGSRRSDQHKLWENIARKQAAMGVASDTGAMGDIYEQKQADVQGYLRAFEPTARQVGAVYFINGAVRGLELFDASATFRKFMRKVLESYALDAAEEAAGSETTGAAAPTDAGRIAQEFLERLQKASPKPYKAIAEGEDVRVNLGDVTAGALVVGDKVVHLAAFAVEGDRATH